MAVAGLGLLAACERVLGPTQPTQPSAAVVQVVTSPDIVTLDPYQTQQFLAYGRTQAGDTVAVVVSWSVSGGRITSGGLYTTDSIAGTYLVTATTQVTASAPAATPASTTVSGSSQVRNRGPLTQVILTPATASVTVGKTLQFAAYGGKKNGDSVAVTVAYSATGGTISAAGLYTAGQSAGTYRVIATQSGGTLADTAAVTLSSVPVASVTVSPTAASLTVGATTQLTATAKDSTGTVLTGREVTWASSKAAVATVSASGLVTGLATGSATISATSEGKSSTAAITATTSSCLTSAGAWQDSTIPSQTSPFEAQFDAMPSTANMDGVAGLSNGAAADYTSLAAIVRFNSAGTIDARNGGAYSAAATILYTAGATYHFRLDVNLPSHTYDIYVTPAGASEQLLGRGFTFRTEQAAVSVLNNWDVYADVGSATACNLAIASWTPPPPAPVASVTVSPAAASVTVGATTLLTASPKDSNGTPLTGRTVTWVSSNTALATVSASGLVTGVAAGSATITATSEGKNGTSVISVTNAPVATVTVTPAVASILVGATLQLTATPKDSLGNPLSGRVVTWSSNALSVASVTGTGLVTGVAVGFATITATSEGVSGSAAITVTVLSTGGNYYVAPSGSDANPCSAAAPCFTMQRVSQLLAPGDVAHFAAGNYSWGVQNVSVSGTASARITYISDVKWGAKITGGCPALENNGDYVDFVNFDVTGSCATGIMVNGNYNGVIGNHVHDLPGNNGGYGGILVDCCKYTSKGDRIIGNVVHDIATSLGQSNTVHGIYVANAATIVQNNIVYRAAGWGLQLWHCPTNDTLSNNTVFNNFNGGIVIGGNSECPFASTNSNSVINNNIVYNNGTASNANGYGIEEYASGGIVNAQYANNLVYGNSPGNWNLMVTGGQGTNTVTAAPLFINYNPTGWGDYHEAVGSPSIDAGTSSRAPSIDFDAVLRPQGPAYDIGAYEWH